MKYYDDFYDGLKDNGNILYRQIDTVSSLNKLFSTLYCEIINIKNYKINLIGDNTISYKEYLSKIITLFNEYIVEIEGLIKIKEGYPIYQILDIENISLIKTLPSIDYKINTMISNLREELKILNKITTESIENSLKEQDYNAVLILSKLSFNLNKIIKQMPL